MDNGRRTRSAKERFWWFGKKYHQYLKVYLADLPNWTKPLGYWWKRLHRASLVRGMYHQENASTLWAFNVNEKMQILPLHIKSIVNLNFTRAHESTSPNACTRRCGAAVPPPPRSPAVGFINIFFVAFKWFKMMHMQYYIHVQSECINVELYKDLGEVLCHNGLWTILKNVNYILTRLYGSHLSGPFLLLFQSAWQA